MNLEKAMKLNRYGLYVLCICFPLGFIISAFNSGSVESAVITWFFGLGLYLPIYVIYAEYKGSIFMPQSTVNINKTTSLLGFRCIQASYVALSFFLFFQCVNEIT